jgi:multisubunit Na+/H+ antiporter MnhB subunit
MKRSPSKVREGMVEIGDNTQGAEASAAVDAYNARKRSVGFRSFLLLVPVAVVLAVLRSPILGFDLLLGGACGLGNMWLVMRNNERLLTGRRSRGVYGLMNVVRILGIGIVPVFSAVTGPWWSMGIALAGFFAPLVLYALALRQEYSTG